MADVGFPREIVGSQILLGRSGRIIIILLLRSAARGHLVDGSERTTGKSVADARETTTAFTDILAAAAVCCSARRRCVMVRSRIVWVPT